MGNDTATVISVTPGAAEKARSLAEREGRPDACLRVRVLAGGCSGFTYKLSFEDRPGENDHIIETKGFRVLVDPKSAPIVEGSTLDFNDALLGGGLRMLNPQAKNECACGDSFAI
ncbi:MAG: iron-sulfur cluster assembly accessory protein [Actinomycetota bacterium]